MHVAVFGRDLRVYGGGERYTIAIVSELNRLSGVKAHVFTYKKDTELRIDDLALKKLLGAKVSYYNSLKLFGERIPLTYSALRALSKIKNYDVVYGTNCGTIINIVFPIVCRLYGKKYILKLTDLNLLEHKGYKKYQRQKINPFRLFGKRLALKLICNIHVPSKDLVKLLISAGYKGNIYYIPNFLYDQQKRPQQYSRNKGKFTVLYVGRLTSYVKGLDLLDKIIARVLSLNKNIIFNIVGALGDGQPIIEKITKKYPKNVFWKGFNIGSSLVYQYKNSDLFIMPSRYETFGLSLLEAQSYGLPAVAFKSPGSKEIMQSQIQGKLVPKYDWVEFSDSILDYYHLWVNKDNYVHIKREISGVLYQRYSKPKIIQEILRMFDKACK